MRTGRSLTVCWGGGSACWGNSLLGGLPGRGASLPEGGLGGSPCWRVSLPGVSLPGGLLARGFSLPGGSPCQGVSLLGGPPFWGVSLVGGGFPCLGGSPCLAGASLPGVLPAGDPPVDRITDMSKNITLATTSLRPVIMNH